MFKEEIITMNTTSSPDTRTPDGGHLHRFIRQTRKRFGGTLPDSLGRVLDLYAGLGESKPDAELPEVERAMAAAVDNFLSLNPEVKA